MKETKKEENSKKKKSYKDKTCYLYMIGAIAVFFLIQPILTPLFIKINEKWISKCSEAWYAIIIILTALIVSGYLIYKRIKYNLFVTHKNIATFSFAIIIYFYYRFKSDFFDFWPPGMFSYTDSVLIPYIILIFLKLHYKKPKQVASSDYILLDFPIEDMKDDRFQYQNLVDSLLDDLKSVDVREHAYSIGISAFWGCGKSSFLNLFSNEAIKQKDIVIRFYPRSSRSIDDIQEDFFETFGIELEKFHTGIKYMLKKYANALQINNGDKWMTHIANACISLNVTKERDMINETIKKVGRKIFVITDDLDRLTAKEILEVLKLIDKNGNFCNTIFLTAYDKGYVNDVLKKKLGYNGMQNFTDKYFDYEVSLPVQNVAILTSYFREYLSKYLIVKEEDAITKQMIIEVWDKESLVIIRALGTIRHVKRFINIFMSRYPKVKNDVDIKDFLLLTLLRYKDINVYNAIANGDVVRNSISGFGVRKRKCLKSDYTETLKNIAQWDGSKEILEELFPKDDNASFSIIDDYNHIRLLSHFDLYFYDYKVGNIYYKDLIKLFRIQEDKEAFTLIDKIFQEKQELQLQEFLRSRTMDLISNKETLIRWFKLLVYADINRDINIEASIAWFLQKDTIINEAKKYRVVTDANAYKDAIKEAINEMIEFRPVQLGYLMINIINNLLSEQVHENPFILTHQELAKIAVKCQRYYYHHKFGTDEWNYTVAFELCKIIGPKNIELYDYPAQCEIFSMMKTYPDDFAKNLFSYNLSENRRILSLEFIKAFEVKKIFPIDGKTFEDWLTLISDKTTVEVLRYIYKKTLKNEKVQIPVLLNSYEKIDMITIKKAIDREEKRIQIGKILSECNNKFVVDLTMLKKDTGIDIERIKELLIKLVKNQKLPKRFASLKVSMEPFMKDDYVRLKESVYEQLKNTLFYKDNIFKINSLDSRNVELDFIGKKLEIDDIEPIPIDGIADNFLYYDPMTMASYIPPGQPAPIIQPDYSYYMENMKNWIDTDKKTFYEKIKQRNCQYVHEVQHFLREKDREDGLEIKRSINEKLLDKNRIG